MIQVQKFQYSYLKPLQKGLYTKRTNYNIVLHLHTFNRSKKIMLRDAAFQVVT
jgi:hypothetical protein